MQEADENGSDGLDIDEFKEAFGHILGVGKNKHQMALMFMKIDTNCDGTIDWVRERERERERDCDDMFPLFACRMSSALTCY